MPQFVDNRLPDNYTRIVLIQHMSWKLHPHIGNHTHNQYHTFSGKSSEVLYIYIYIYIHIYLYSKTSLNRPTIWDRLYCLLLFYAIAIVYFSYIMAVLWDVWEEKEKAWTYSSTTQGIFDLRNHIGMVWEELAFGDAVSYTQRGNGQLNVMAVMGFVTLSPEALTQRLNPLSYLHLPNMQWIRVHYILSIPALNHNILMDTNHICMIFNYNI